MTSTTLLETTAMWSKVLTGIVRLIGVAKVLGHATVEIAQAATDAEQTARESKTKVHYTKAK